MKQTSFRISDETAELLSALAKKFDRSRTTIFAMAVRLLARRAGLAVSSVDSEGIKQTSAEREKP
jgi:predicted transcriptional regulator